MSEDPYNLIPETEIEKLRAKLDEMREPISMILNCPNCGYLHVDNPEPEKGWTNPPHKSHLCHSCGTIWRPADVPTTGVAAISTRGDADTWPLAQHHGTQGEKQFNVGGE